MNEITEEKLKKYFEVTKAALKKAEDSDNRTELKEERLDFLDMRIAMGIPTIW